LANDIDYPKVSIVLPVYNCQDYVSFAIQSMLGQTFTDFELIILNDGSTDNSLEVINQFSNDSRLRVISRENRGLVATLNEGLSLATGQYIARMDADDISIDNRLELQLAFMESHPTIAVLGTGTELINQDGVFIRNICHPSGEKLEVDMVLGNFIAHPTVMMRKSVIDEIGGYRKPFEQAEDYDLWLRVLSQGYRIDNLPDVLLKYRQTISGISFSNRQTQDVVAKMASIAFQMRKKWGKDPFEKRSDSISIADLKDTVGEFITKEEYNKFELLWFGCYILNLDNEYEKELVFIKHKSELMRSSIALYYFRKGYFYLLDKNYFKFLKNNLISMLYNPSPFFAYFIMYVKRKLNLIT
jgi:glycosyltransferase involved in cell wall biosynthesis